MNPKSLFLLLVSCLSSLFVSCQSGPADSDGECTITFSVSNYRQISFDDLSPSQATRAAETVAMTLANLSLTVFDAETNERVMPTILHKAADYEDEGVEKARAFSQFSVSLPYGRYRVLVLGYNGSRECRIASLRQISWAEDYVPNTFLYCEEFTLDEDASLSKEITLRRVVSAFHVTAEDAVPAELKKMRFISNAGGTVLDAMTGFSTQNTGRTSEITVPESYVGTEGLDLTVYLFLPEEQATASYTVQALGQNDVVVSQKRFFDVPLRINYMTEWSGMVFDGTDDVTPDVQGGFGITWDMDWAGTLHVGN